MAMTFSPSSTPEPITPPTPQRRRGRARELSNPTPPDYSRAPNPPKRTAHWQLWFLLVVLVSLALAILAPILLGIYVGEQERSDYVHLRAVEHYKQALAYEAEDYAELAIAELQIALKFDPAYQEAADRLKALQSASGGGGTPAPSSASVADQLFTGAQAALAKQQWSDAIDYLEEIRRANPNYRAGEIKTLLIQAYLDGGNQAVSAGEIDQAQVRFNAALALDPSNQEAKSLRDRAQLYLSATHAVDSDWQSAVLDFQQLYQLDPNFYDVKQQLVNALIQYGDLASKQGATCIAAREYDQAVSLGAESVVGSKLAEASSSCRQAVTAPTPTPTPLNGIGSFVAAGRAAAGAACQGIGGVSGTVRDAQGTPLAGILIQIYNDVDYKPPPFTSDAGGGYNIVLGKDAGLFHLVVIAVDGTPASEVFDIKYPGGAASGCHWIVDWTRSE